MKLPSKGELLNQISFMGWEAKNLHICCYTFGLYTYFIAGSVNITGKNFDRGGGRSI